MNYRRTINSGEIATQTELLDEDQNRLCFNNEIFTKVELIGKGSYGKVFKIQSNLNKNE